MAQAFVSGDLFRYAEPHPTDPGNRFLMRVPVTFVGADLPNGVGVDVDITDPPLDCAYVDLDNANGFKTKLVGAVNARAAELGYPLQRIFGPSYQKWQPMWWEWEDATVIEWEDGTPILLEGGETPPDPPAAPLFRGEIRRVP